MGTGRIFGQLTPEELSKLKDHVIKVVQGTAKGPFRISRPRDGQPFIQVGEGVDPHDENDPNRCTIGGTGEKT